MHSDDPAAADAAGEGPVSGSRDTEAASNGDADATKPARKRRIRRRRRTPSTGDSGDGAGPSAEAADDSPAPEASEAPPADRAGTAEEAEPGAKPRRRRRKRRTTKSRGARRARDGDDASEPEGAGSADGGRRPAKEPDAEGADADDAKARRRRRRRKRRAALTGGDASIDAADRGEAGGDESASGRTAREGTGDDPRRKRRRRGRKGGRDKSSDADTPKASATKSSRRRKDGRREGRKGGRREGRKEGRREGRRDGRGDGRRDDRRERHRGRDGRRDRRVRDPRAVDIVPKPDWGGTEERLEKLLLVNASDREEARIALLVNGRLEEVYIEALKERSAAGNIYRGRVQNVEIGIGAAFVDLGRGLTGFLHASDMPLKEEEEPGAKVTDRLHPGDEVIVQITRDGIGRKGPALTGRISLPGRYLVLMPFTDRSGISRRIPRGPERERMRKLVRQLEVPEGMGVIVRTASETTDLAALNADLQHLVSEWERIRLRAAEPGQPGVLRGESDIAERSVRDIMPSDVARIVVDKEQTAGRIHQLLRIWYPSEAAAAAEAGHLSIRMAAAEAETPVGELRAKAPGEEDEETGAELPRLRVLDASTPAVRGAAAGAAVEGGDAVAPEPPAEEPVEPVEPVEPAESSVESAEAEPAEAEPAEDEPAEDEPADLEEEASEDDALDVDDELDEDDEDDEDDDENDDDEDDEDDEAPEEDRAARELRLEEQRRLAKIIPEVLLHTDLMPLFHTYDVETQLEDAFRRALRLPSGGSIVIDPTEALVAVDVNSGRLTDESDPETTALKTNLEAVGEIARQLRLRDLGGLVVLDFIDMRERKSRRDVEKALHESLSRDRARIRVGRMGPFGCVILSRQRIRQALTRVTHEECDSCGGTGRRRVTTGLGLRVLREMEARVSRSRGRGGLEVRAPQAVVEWINRSRGALLKQLRKACSGPVSISSDSRLAVDGWAMKGTPPSTRDDGSEA